MVQLPDAVLKLVLGLFIIAVTWASIPGFERLGRGGITIGSAVTALLHHVRRRHRSAACRLLLEGPARRPQGAGRHPTAAGMTVQHSLKIVVFGLAGFAFATWLPLIAIMMVSGYFGTVYGSRLLERLPEEAFRRWFRIGLTLLALDLLRQGATALWAA